MCVLILILMCINIIINISNVCVYYEANIIINVIVVIL